MRDPERIDVIIEKLRAVWKKNPDLRITQLLWALARSNYTFFYVEDDFVEKRLDRALLNNRLDE